MEHCGNQYPTNFWNTPKWAQAGAFGLRGGHHWTVRNNVIRYANTVALDLGSSGGDNERERAQIGGAPYGADNLIEKNWFLDNGSAAIIGSGSQRVVVRGNVILRNNTYRFNGPKRYEHAGIKFHYVRDGLIEDNYVADNPLSEGIWLDNQFPGTRVTRNVVVNNGARGIFLEMSDYKFDAVLVDHNISVGNQPHSEVAALALFMNILMGGVADSDNFPDARLEVKPHPSGKVVIDNQEDSNPS